jgi:NAD-dependent histone deacetylase SIR2
VTKEAISRVHARLREVGIEQFVQENLSNDPASARRLGPIFGLDPELEIDDGFYLRVLSAAIVRAYHKRQKLYQYNTIDDAARLLTTCSKIMVITGAGISTSLGIPDFRSKGTGFYDKVRQMGFDEPEDVFDIDYFEERPE